MTDIIRKAILFGIGSAYLTKEKVQEFVDDLVKKDNINAEEGKKLVNETLDKLKEYRDKQQGEIKSMITKIMDEVGVATKKDLDNLKKDLKSKK